MHRDLPRIVRVRNRGAAVPSWGPEALLWSMMPGALSCPLAQGRAAERWNLNDPGTRGQSRAKTLVLGAKLSRGCVCRQLMPEMRRFLQGPWVGWLTTEGQHGWHRRGEAVVLQPNLKTGPPSSHGQQWEVCQISGSLPLCICSGDKTPLPQTPQEWDPLEARPGSHDSWLVNPPSSLTGTSAPQTVTTSCLWVLPGSSLQACCLSLTS